MSDPSGPDDAVPGDGLPANPPPGNALPELRASDAEREQAAEVLRVAASEGRLDVEELEDRLGLAYSMRNRSELERLLADVSPERLGAGRALVQPGQSGGLTVREGPGGSRWVISVMGGHDKRGKWRIAPRCTVLSVMGGSSIDLNDAELSDRVTEINVYSLMGGSEIRVPHGVNVQVSEFALMGGNDVKLGDEISPAGGVGGPSIHIRMVAVMGGSSVRRGRKLSRRERRELEEAQKRERELGDGSRGELEP